MRPTMQLISALVTVATLAYGSALLHAEAQVPVARVIAAEEGLVHTGSIGATIHFKIGSLSTGATQVFLATGIVPPGVETPVHLHEVDEEVLYVLEGEITLKLNDTVHKVSAGGIAFIPPGTWM